MSAQEFKRDLGQLNPEQYRLFAKFAEGIIKNSETILEKLRPQFVAAGCSKETLFVLDTNIARLRAENKAVSHA